MCLVWSTLPVQILLGRGREAGSVMGVEKPGAILLCRLLAFVLFLIFPLGALASSQGPCSSSSTPPNKGGGR